LESQVSKVEKDCWEQGVDKKLNFRVTGKELMVRMRGATEGWKRKLAMMVEVFEVAVDGAFDGGGTMWSTMVAWWWWFPSEKGRRRRKGREIR